MIQFGGRMPVRFKAHAIETDDVSQVEKGFICNTEKTGINPAEQVSHERHRL